MTSYSKNIVIVGAGRAGKLLSKDIENHYRSFRVVGFIDDQPSKRGAGKILGKISDFQKILSTYRIDEIVIAIPSADGGLIRKILLANIQNRIPLKIVPRNQRIIRESDVRYEEVRDVNSEDFLGRPFVRKNVDVLKGFYVGKKVFVTGGAGSIGSEIVRQLIDLGAEKVFVYDNSEYLLFNLEQQLKERGQRDTCELIVGNILHDNKLRSLFSRIRPDIVFHAAAYKHVHLMQDNIDEAVYNNVVGTKRVIDAAIENGIRLFTFISTDKAVNPTSIMGATKKLCEYYIQHLASKETEFNIVRFGNVINSNGSALPLFERQMALHGYVTITHEKMMRFFMSIREAAQLVIESTAKGQPDSIHILNMGELLNIREIAECLIRSKNMIPGKDIDMRVIGLRKGEKLVEELYTEIEKKNLMQTGIGNILRLRNEECCALDIEKVFFDLEEMAKRGGSSDELGRFLKRMFPSLKRH
jgi:FlaA1/EpsC-like NDP-sugar epimerase